METGHHQEPSAGWREAGVSGEEWTRLQTLLEVVRQEHLRMELSPERREQIRQRVMERWEKREARRRRWRVFVVGASAALIAGLVVMLVRRA